MGGRGGGFPGLVPSAHLPKSEQDDAIAAAIELNLLECLQTQHAVGRRPMHGLVRSSFAASRCTGIVLTRGALQPLREALKLLGEDDSESSMAEYVSPHVSGERRA